MGAVRPLPKRARARKRSSRLTPTARFYSVHDIEVILNVSRAKVISMIHLKALPAVKIQGVWRVPIRQFDRQFPG